MQLFKKKMTRLALIITLGIALLFTVACSNELNSPSAKTSGAPITVGTLQIADALPLYVAEKEGYFKEAGLNVTIQPFKSSSEESQALSANSIQIAMNDMIVESLLKKEGTDVRTIAIALGAKQSEGRFVIVSAPHSHIKTPADLKGKRIAISRNTMMEYLADSYLSQAQLSKQEVTYINMPNLLLRMETLLTGTDIDAAILPDPLATIAINRGAQVVIDDTKLEKNYSQSVIIASQKWLTANESDKEAFLTAYNKAIQAINTNPENYRPLLIKVARLPENLHATYPIPTFTEKAVPSEESVSHIENWLVQHHLLTTPYNYNEMVLPQ